MIAPLRPFPTDRDGAGGGLPLGGGRGGTTGPALCILPTNGCCSGFFSSRELFGFELEIGNNGSLLAKGEMEPLLGGATLSCDKNGSDAKGFMVAENGFSPQGLVSIG